MNVVVPGSLENVMLPWCLSTSFLQIPRPRPLPSPAALVVKNVENTRCCMSVGMPGPLSVNLTMMSVAEAAVFISSVPRLFIA